MDVIKTVISESLSGLGNLIVIALKNTFWFLIDIFKELAIAIIDWIASLLPSYTIPVPSVFFGNNPVLPFLNWIFPVDHFIVCLSIIIVNMGLVFAFGPLLRIIRVAK